jgi:hypothetical protein
MSRPLSIRLLTDWIRTILILLIGFSTCLLNAASITDGLVGHYKLEGNANDSSASGNHATEIGGPGFVTGKIGQALALNGVDQSANASDPPGLTGPGPKSVSVWFNQSSKVAKSVVSFGGFDQGILFEVLAFNGTLSGHFYGAGFDTADGGPAYTVAQWHHAVITYDGATVRSYLDGQFGNEKQLALNTADSDVLNIGSGYLPFFNGLVDDVGLWSRELSAAEVQSIYVAGLVGKDLSQAVVTPVTTLIKSPVEGALFAPGSNIQIDASATTAGGSTVAKVEFFADATKIGEAAVEPYSITWTNVTTGRFQITTKATDSQGQSGTSPAVSIVVTPAATVRLASPTDGATYTSGTNILIEAAISDTQGAVTRVEFFFGTNRIGEATSAPYIVNWSNVTTRGYVLTAKATDRNGDSAVSSPVNILVLPPPPQGLITDGLVGHYKFEGNANDSSPSANHATEIGGPTYVAGQMGQALSVNGTDQRADAPTAPLLTGNTPQSVSVWFNQTEPANKGVLAYGDDGNGHRFEVLLHSGVSSGHFWGGGFDTIAGGPAYTAGEWHHAVITYDGKTVRSYLDGQFGNEKELALDIREGPLHLGSGEPDGGFVIYAYFNGLVDDVGLWNRTLSQGDVAAIYKAGLAGKDLTQAIAPPKVALTSPIDAATFVTGANIPLQATAAGSGARVITKVEFFSGTNKIGEAIAAPFSVTLSNATAGRYTFTAKATDDGGSFEISAAIKVLVTQTVPITAGLMGHYKFDGNPNDSSSSAHHGTEIGGPTYVAGRIGQALQVNGTDQRVDAPDPGLIGNVPQSVSVWFNQDTRANKGMVAYGDDGDGHRFEVLVHSGVFAGHFWGGGYDTIAGGPPYTTNEWHHGVITYDGKTVRSYLDGRFGNQADLALDIREGPLHLGSGEPDGGFINFAYFNGRVDDVGLWNRELNPDEVEAIYSAGLAGRDLETAAVSIRPILKATVAGGAITVSWPESGADFVLQTADNLSSPTWVPETTVPVVESGIKKVVVPMTGTARFYRLRK